MNTLVASSDSVDFNSSIYIGRVHHKRYSPTEHGFSYPMYMLGLDLDELDTLDQNLRFFGYNRFSALSLRRRDYLDDNGLSLKQAVLEKVAELGGDASAVESVMLLGQVRCFGLYFSPVNFFFCYQQGKPRYMLAEVHNTPWNERHCYLVDVENPQQTKKDFHVSPFMGMDMQYHWRIEHNDQRILVHIENWQQDKLFDATLSVQQQALTSSSLFTVLKQWPVMTLTILKGIYWQALKLFIKKVPYHSHP